MPLPLSPATKVILHHSGSLAPTPQKSSHQNCCASVQHSSPHALRSGAGPSKPPPAQALWGKPGTADPRRLKSTFSLEAKAEAVWTSATLSFPQEIGLVWIRWDWFGNVGQFKPHIKGYLILLDLVTAHLVIWVCWGLVMMRSAGAKARIRGYTNRKRSPSGSMEKKHEPPGWRLQNRNKQNKTKQSKTKQNKTSKQTNRQTNKPTNQQTNKQASKQTNKQSSKQTNTKSKHTHTHKQTSKQASKQTNKQTHKQTCIHTSHYTTLHDITLHCIALHCIALHYITLHTCIH